MRTFLALAAATLSAPFLTMLCLSIAKLFSDPIDSWSDILGFFVSILFMGGFGVVMFGIPIFFASAMTVLILSSLRLWSLPVAMASGAILGAAFVTAVLFDEGSTALSDFVLAALPAGAISGWIFWRIAGGLQGAEASTPVS